MSKKKMVQDALVPDEITPAHLRGSVRLLVFWNSGEGCFHVPDPGESGPPKPRRSGWWSKK